MNKDVNIIDLYSAVTS